MRTHTRRLCEARTHAHTHTWFRLTPTQDRRPGDVASCYAKPDLANSELKWQAERGLKDMCEDMWRWQNLNPEGFPDSE